MQLLNFLFLELLNKRIRFFITNYFKTKKNIEDNFGGSLSWEELPDNKASRVRVIIEDVNFYNNEDWSQMSKFLVENLPKFERAFIPFVEKIRF